MVRGILFDIDGTLIDHDKAQERALARFHAARKGEDALWDLETFAREWEHASSSYFDEYIKGAITFRELRALRTQYVYGKHGISLAHRDAYDLYLQYKAFYEASWDLYDDVLPCLDALGSYVLGVVSNGSSGQQRRKLVSMGIGRYFSVQVMSEDIGCAKPKKEIFLYAAELMRLSPQEIVVVGDDEKTDIRGAVEAGMHTILLSRNGTAPVTTAEHVVSALDDVPAIVSARI